MLGSNLYPSRLITSNVFQIALSAVIHNAVDGLGRGRALKNETEQARQENLRRMMITTTQNTSIASLHRVPMFPPKQFNTRFNGDSRSLSATNPNKHLFNVQNETMLAIGVLTASFICLVSIQVYRQVGSIQIEKIICGSMVGAKSFAMKCILVGWACSALYFGPFEWLLL